MEDLALFTKLLINKKQDEFNKQLLQYEQTLENQKNSELLVIEQNKVKAMQQIDQNMKEQLQLTVQKMTNQKRNDVLVAKQEKLLSLFDEALVQMGKWTDEKTEHFFNQIVLQLPQGHYIIKRGEFTPISFKLPSNMTLSKEVVLGEYGFIFESDGIVYNYLYRLLLNELKTTYLAKLMQQLNQK